MTEPKEWLFTYWRRSTGSIIIDIDVCVHLPTGFELLSCVELMSFHDFKGHICSL